jgi:dTDP-4-dehydrorhamnose 3,5-epimerase-like enzyme
MSNFKTKSNNKKPFKFEDNRGTLFFPIKGNKNSFTECTVSVNKKNVFRGIHINDFDKLVTCVRGKILDIAISPDNEVKYFLLTPDFENQVFIPANYGHGFLSLEDDSILIYHFNGTFLDHNTKFIHYKDPSLNLQLPEGIDFILSENSPKALTTSSAVP